MSETLAVFVIIAISVFAIVFLGVLIFLFHKFKCIEKMTRHPSVSIFIVVISGLACFSSLLALQSNSRDAEHKRLSAAINNVLTFAETDYDLAAVMPDNFSDDIMVIEYHLIEKNMDYETIGASEVYKGKSGYYVSAAKYLQQNLDARSSVPK